MPYEKREYNGQVCIFVEGEDTPIEGGCYETDVDAQQYLEALETNVEEAHKDTDPEATKTGRVLSGVNADAISDALQKLLTVLRRAGIDISDVQPGEAPEAIMARKFVDDEQLITLPTPLHAIKALADDRVGGYLVVWGSPQQRDLQGEYFTPDTELGLDWYDRRPMLYHHGLDGTLKSDVIGIIDTLKEDEVGVWAEAQLDLRNRYVQAVRRLIQKGILAWSSGSLQHLVEVQEGYIKCWPIVEGSATPTPAEPRQTGISTVKSYLAHSDATGSLIELDAEEAPAKEDDPPARKDDGGLSTPVSTPFSAPIEGHIRGLLMNPEMIDSIIRAVEAKLDVQLTDEQRASVIAELSADQLPPDAPLSEDEMAKASIEMAGKAMETVQRVVKQRQQRLVDRAVKSAFATAIPVSHAIGNGHKQDAVHINVSSPYDSVKPEAMEFIALICRAANPYSRMSELWYKAIADKLEHSGKSLPRNVVVAIKAIKSGELDNSTTAGSGDEWVPDHWDSSLWARQRLENTVAASLSPVDMPTDPYELPVQSTDPTVFFVPETTDETQLTISGSGNPIPDSKVVTAKTTLDAKKLALRVGYSTELEEDAIIPFANDLNDQAQRAILNAIDNAIINGDTDATASTNINLIDGTPAATSIYLIFDGLRKLPLVTATTLSVDGGGVSPTLAAIRSARFKLLNAYAVNPSNLRIVCDVSTYAKLLSLPEYITMDKAGPQATAQTGVVGFIDGIPVSPSNEYALTNNAGKIPTAGGTLGSLIIYAPYAWKVGYRRRVRLSTSFIDWADSYQLTGTVRVALARRDALCSAVLYNLAV